MSDSGREGSSAQAPGCLHLLLRPERSLLQDCLACCAGGDCLVLMGAAVTLLAGPWPKSALEIEFCCIEADVRAHGLDELVRGSGWKRISDLDLVERVVRHRHCLTWK